jgi:hypothetical protein
MGRGRLKTYLAVSALCTALFGAYCAVQVSREDRMLTFVREVPTALPVETLSLSLSSVGNWSKWFFNAGKVERIDLASRPLPLAEQTLVQGAVIRLEILPHKGEHRGSFDLLVQVSQYEPGRRVVLELIKDQSSRISRLFDKVQWTIELVPAGDAGKPSLMIRGTETTHTHHWRARLFAGLSERILLNQVFYPDLMALGQFTQPLPPNPFPAYGQ